MRLLMRTLEGMVGRRLRWQLWLWSIRVFHQPDLRWAERALAVVEEEEEEAEEAVPIGAMEAAG
jgi:hypothetical protein